MSEPFFWDFETNSEWRRDISKREERREGRKGVKGGGIRREREEQGDRKGEEGGGRDDVR